MPESEHPSSGGSAVPALMRRVKRHVVGKRQRFFAVVKPGFEETAMRELLAIGIEPPLEIVPGGVGFVGKLESCYRANIASRTVTRILMRLTSFPAQHFETLRERVTAFPWELHLADGARVGFRVTAARSRLYHEGRIEEEFAAGISARMRQHELRVHFEAGADGEPGAGAQTVFVRFRKDQCKVSLDASGEALHKRGRRRFVTEASLRETIAAAILLESGWPEPDILIDPMCGAGTFAIEARGIAEGILPNANREFPFFTWPAFRSPAYEHMKKHLVEQARSARVEARQVVAFDADRVAVETTRRNLAGTASAGLDDSTVLHVGCADFLGADAGARYPAFPVEARRLYVLNPPYGKRLRGGDTRNVYREIGRVLKRRQPCGYAVIVPGLEIEKALSLGYDKKILFKNGGIPVSVLIRRCAPAGAERRS